MCILTQQQRLSKSNSISYSDRGLLGSDALWFSRPPRVGLGSSQEIFSGPLIRADQLKIFTLNRKGQLLFAESFRLGKKSVNLHDRQRVILPRKKKKKEYSRAAGPLPDRQFSVMCTDLHTPPVSSALMFLGIGTNVSEESAAYIFRAEDGGSGFFLYTGTCLPNYKT